MECRVMWEPNATCDLCKKNDGEVWDNEVLVKGVQVIRFFAHIACKNKMFKLLKQGM